jgi:hypothetical protein
VLAVVQGAVGIADLGHPEAVGVLPQQVVGHRAAVEQDGVDLRHLTDAGVVGIADIPVLEDAVPTGREHPRDGLFRLELSVVADDVLRAEVGEHDRVRNRRGTAGSAVEHQRPQQPDGDEPQGDRPCDQSPHVRPLLRFCEFRLTLCAT